MQNVNLQRKILLVESNHGRTLLEAEETERLRNAEKESLETQRIYRELFESSPVPMWTYDLDTLEILEVNDAAVEFYGYSREEFLSMTIKDIRPEEELPKLFGELTKRSTLIEHKGIWKHKKKSGEVVFVEKVLHPVPDRDGRHRRLVSAINVTGKKLAEEALVSSERKFRALIENSYDVIALLRADGTAVYVSPPIYNVLGYQPQDLINKNLFETLHYEGNKKSDELHDAVLKHPRTKFEEQAKMTDKNGQWKWVEITLTNMLDDGSVNAIVVNFRNITEHRIAEDNLRTSEERFHSIAESTMDAIILADKGGRIIEWNEGARKIFGYSRKEILNRTIAVIIPERSREVCRKSLLHCSLTGKTCDGKTVELYCLRKDGTEFPAELSVSTWMKDDEIFLSSIIRDITERKNAEEQLRDSLIEKETLLKEIHHRTKNNFQLIASLLRLQSRSIANKELVEILHESQNRIKSMALIHQKLYKSGNFAEIECGPYVGNLVSDLINTYSSKGKEISGIVGIKNISLNIETLIPLGLIINELVSNSIKHAFPNIQKGIVEIELDKQNDDYLLTYRDNGAGIPDDIDINESCSFGMQLVQTLVEQIEGTLELNKDKGTEFRIQFKKLNYTKRI